MKIILKQNEPNPIKDDARFNETGVKELVQHQGHAYRVLNYVRRLTPCECFIRGLAWALSCITIIPIIFCRAGVNRLLNEARTKSERKIVYTPIDLQPKFDKFKEHIKNIEVKPAFIDELVTQDLSLENYSSLKKWLKARDTLVVWAEIAKEVNTEVGDLDVCGFPDVETTVERASKFGDWCAQNANKVAKIKFLGLIGKQLTYLPKEIGNFSQLERLNLCANQLTYLPKEIGKLSQLANLDLSNNQLTDLPEEIGNLSQLTVLFLGVNQFGHLPKEIWNLSRLKGLYLNNNQLTDLPEEIGNLSQLISLTLTSNQLTHLPGEVGCLSQLTFLGLDYNQLTDLPEEIGNLSKLKYLYLKRNPLKEIPQEIANLERSGCTIYR